MGKDVVAIGKTILLRRKRLDDALLDYQWRTDPELTALDASRPIRLSYREYLRYHRDELEFPTPWSRKFAIETRDSRFIGNCMCYDINTVTSEAEVGILLGDKDCWGKGYGTEALKLLVSHVFKVTSLKRLYLHTLSWNTRAKLCFAKCGFQELRVVVRNGMEFFLMELIKDDWIANQSYYDAEQVYPVINLT